MLSLDPNGYIAVVLYSYSDGMNHGKDDGVLFKTDANGNMLWAVYYGSTG